MGLQAFLVDQNYRTQLRNGGNFADNPTDFTTFLQANVGEKVQVISTYYLKWFSQATEFGTITVQDQNTIVTQSVNFEQDGWSVGDTFETLLVDGQTVNPLVITGTITAVTPTVLIYNLNTGQVPSGGFIAIGGTITGTNLLDAAIVSYNLIENSENATFNSLIDNEPNQYFASGMASNIGTYIDMEPLINGSQQTWVQGDNQNYNIKIQNRGPTQNGYQEFKVSHEFLVLPYYLDGYSVNYQNGVLPDLFQGANSLKYISRIDARPSLGNVNANKIIDNTNTQGNVGFFNENFNGFPNNFTKQFFNYTNNTALNPSGNNFCFGKVVNNNGSFQNGDEFTIVFSRLSDQNEFLPNTFYEKQFLFSSVTQKIGNSTGLDDNCLKNVKGTVDGQGNLSFTFQLFFNANQSGSGNANLIIPEEDYLIWIIVGSSGKTNQNDDRVSLILDYNNFNPANDVPDLAELNEIQQGRFVEVYNHLNQISNGITQDVYDSFDGMVEDGYVYRFELMTRQDLGAVIQNMSFNMVARDSATLDEFILNTYNFDLTSSLMINANSPFVGQEQFLSLDTTRGFDLSQNDQFNLVNIETLPMEQIGSDVFSKYRITIGFKINWETWQPNNNVNVVFFDQNKPNNNLNNRVSNYSDELGYILYPRLDVVLSNNPFTDPSTNISYESSNTLYKIFLPPCVARDYGDDSIPKKGQAPIHRVSIRTTKTSDGLNTNGTLLTNEDTKISATFNRIDALPMTFSGYAGVIRIDVQNGGLFSIQELSTLADNVPITNGLLKPEGQNTRATLTVGAQNNFVRLDCLVDKDKVVEGTNYVISARLWADDQVIVQGEKRMENDTLKLLEDGTQKFVE